MALSQPLRNTMLPSELEFIASEEMVEIMPTIKMDRIRFISGLYGPFVGGRRAKVPLWIAVNLKLKKKCNIIPPDWLNVDFLQERLSREIAEPVFAQMPFRFAETSKVLLDVASDDLDQPDKIRSLLKDLREVRQAKIREGLPVLDDKMLRMPGLCSIEINEVRPFFARAMGVLIQLNMEQTQPEGAVEID